MEISVFDEDRNPATISYSDIEKVKIIGRRLCYLTISGSRYYGPINLKEFAELHKNMGFIQIDKNCVINLSHVQYVVKNEVFINGKKYVIARERRTEFKKKWNERPR